MRICHIIQGIGTVRQRVGLLNVEICCLWTPNNFQLPKSQAVSPHIPSVIHTELWHGGGEQPQYHHPCVHKLPTIHASQYPHSPRSPMHPGSHLNSSNPFAASTFPGRPFHALTSGSGLLHMWVTFETAPSPLNAAKLSRPDCRVFYILVPVLLLFVFLSNFPC